MSKDKIEIEDLDFLKSGEKDQVAIICHDQPDPDCLASAMAFQEIATHFGLGSTIYYGGGISHTQNRVMMNVLNVSAVKLEEDDDAGSIKESIEKSYIVLVDVSEFKKPPCISITGFVNDDREPDLVIDHHELNPKLSCKYIRFPYGSCSTILYKIMESLNLRPRKILSTALYLGISTDTANLQADGVADEDREVFEELKAQIDPEAYEKILNYPRPVALIEMRKKAYSTLVTESTLAIANAGTISTNQRSLLAELCDELLQIESIETAVVMAIVDDGVKGNKNLCASFRSGVLALNMQDFIAKTFGKKYGGGRRGAGAAMIPLDQITSNVIDDIKQRDPDSEKLFTFTQPIFEVYASKIKEENNNI